MNRIYIRKTADSIKAKYLLEGGHACVTYLFASRGDNSIALPSPFLTCPVLLFFLVCVLGCLLRLWCIGPSATHPSRSSEDIHSACVTLWIRLLVVRNTVANSFPSSSYLGKVSCFLCVRGRPCISTFTQDIFETTIESKIFVQIRSSWLF